MKNDNFAVEDFDNDIDVDIFDEVDAYTTSNYAKFENIGDSVQGTYIKRDDTVINTYGSPQTVVTLKQKNGELINVSIRHTKTFLLQMLDKVKYGQIIGFKFTGIKENPGKNPTKIIKLAQDPNIVDTQWLNENKSRIRPVKNPDSPKEVTTQATNVSSAGTKIDTIFALAKEKFNATDEDEIKNVVMEKTGLALININLDLIIERLKNF